MNCKQFREMLRKTILADRIKFTQGLLTNELSEVLNDKQKRLFRAALSDTKKEYLNLIRSNICEIHDLSDIYQVLVKEYQHPTEMNTALVLACDQMCIKPVGTVELIINKAGFPCLKYNITFKYPGSLKFRPFDKVLVRDKKEEVWTPRFFANYINHEIICTDGRNYKYCILYDEETKSLIGTTNEWKGYEE